jgi:hypothetical protein
MNEPLITTAADMADEDAAAEDELVKQIEAEKAELARCEGMVIAAMFGIGLLVDRLCKMGRLTWDQMLKKLGLTDDVAGRYLEYGCGSLARSRPGRATLALLPLDWDKLEWIARLAPSELEELFGKLDPRTASRREVAYAATALLRGRGWAAERDKDPAE